MRERRGLGGLGAALLVALGLIHAAALGLIHAAAAQTAAPDLSRLALEWARGDFRSPLVCEIDGAPRLGLRRVTIELGPPTLERPAAHLRFFDLEVPNGTRCGTETEKDVPNAIGTLSLAHRGRSRPDTAAHDFSSTLRREGGFEYEIVSGRLDLQPAHDPGATRRVDFRGGRAFLGEVKRGTDAWRRLAEYPVPRKLTLRVEAPDGSSLALDLVELPPR
jgi:hypothetical protein